jgi:hypothetical protein
MSGHKPRERTNNEWQYHDNIRFAAAFPPLAILRQIGVAEGREGRKAECTVP